MHMLAEHTNPIDSHTRDAPVLRADGLAKAFGYRVVLKGVQLCLHAGEFVALLGANGSGKSTLLRIVATLLRPDAGQLQIGGVDALTQPGKASARVGAVLHATMHYPDLSGRELMQMHAQLHGVPDANNEIVRQLKAVDLTRRADDRLRTFSRGMLQRLSVARALLHAPTLLLLDEPYTGLDASSAERLNALLQQFCAQGGCALMSTHETGRGMVGVTRMLHLRAGNFTEAT